MAEQITSRGNERVKAACRLAASAAARAEEGLFFAEGARLCLDLAKSLQADTVFFTERALEKYPALAGLAPQCFEVEAHVAEKLAATKNNQGVFALFKTPKPNEKEVYEATGGVLVCEDIQDPGNLGTMLRSAAGLGFGGAVLSPGCADPFGGKALRACMGAVGRMPLLCGVPAAVAAAALKAAGFTVVAATLAAGAQPLASVPVQGKVALMIGNEGAGLSGAAAAAADVRAFLPMANGVESLNAAAAASVLMYHFTAGA